MEYSESTNLTGLVQDTLYLCGIPATDTDAYPIKELTRNINSYYDRVASLIMTADNNWEWDDNNQTDLPIGTCPLVANQQDYGISGATFLKVLKVELKNDSGNWQVLKPISLDDKRNISMTDYKKTAGTPVEYDKFGNSVMLYPKPSYSQAASLKIYYQRNVSHFTYEDTTKVAGFNEQFHRILSLGAAEDYCLRHEITGRIPKLEKMRQELEIRLVDSILKRGRDEKITLKLSNERFFRDNPYGVGYKGCNH